VPAVDWSGSSQAGVPEPIGTMARVTTPLLPFEASFQCRQCTRSRAAVSRVVRLAFRSRRAHHLDGRRTRSRPNGSCTTPRRSVARHARLDAGVRFPRFAIGRGVASPPAARSGLGRRVMLRDTSAGIERATAVVPISLVTQRSAPRADSKEHHSVRDDLAAPDTGRDTHGGHAAERLPSSLPSHAHPLRGRGEGMGNAMRFAMISRISLAQGHQIVW